MSLISVDNSLIVNEILAIDDSPKVVTIEETHGNIVTVQANNAPSIVSISGASLSSQGVLNLPFKVKNNNIGIGPGNEKGKIN